MIMREILFRGKRKDNGQWVYGCYQRIVIHGVMRHFILPSCALVFDNIKLTDALIDVDPSTVSQFTGFLADKRKSDLDKRIFEGDIFRHTKETDEGDNVSYSVVMWIPQYAIFYLIPVEHYEIMRNNDVSKEAEFRWFFEDAWLSDFSIDVELTKVGNIHDNPELLK